MSADLFAAFGVSEPPRRTPVAESVQKLDSHTKLHEPDHTEESPWILQSKFIPDIPSKKKDEALWKTDSNGADVLFDASDAEDEDDFGDFEAASPQKVKQVLQDAHQLDDNNVDLLGLDDFSGLNINQTQNTQRPAADQDKGLDQQYAQSYSSYETKPIYQSDSAQNSVVPPPRLGYQQKPKQQKAPPTNDDDDWGDFEDVGGKSNDTPLPVVAKKPVSIQRSQLDLFQNDEWEAFEDGPPNPPTSKSEPHGLMHVREDSMLEIQSTPKSTPEPSVPSHHQPTPQPSLSEPRPTNIPPPSTLLQLLPKIYRNLSTQSRNSNPISNLANLTLQIYLTTAHIIAGRSSRWKRDMILSQSTRISQAGVKHTGMKLTALDKSESIKEEQEAQEAIAAWQRHAAALNAVMLKAKVQKPPMSLSANMAARVTNGSGVLTAKECCAVCGLNRNERIMGIDVKIEDTFGEFWVEHWGHRNCREFWYTYEGLLNKR